MGAILPLVFLIGIYASENDKGIVKYEVKI